MFDRMDIEASWYTSGMGAHLTWTLPFGLLIMFAIFNRFDKSYEEAARDLGASPWQVMRFVVIPIITPSLVGVGLFGFTLSFLQIIFIDSFTPYNLINDRSIFFDLVYNPAETLFMKKGNEMGAKVTNGLKMLEYQAEKSWELWHEFN